MRDLEIGAALLEWYDAHARRLPWRVGPAERGAGQRPDPYRVWLSEIMLQQTTVAAVGKYFRRFTSLWPTVQALAAAEDAEVMAEWAGLGYYARARNLLKCARAVAAMGAFPDTMKGLQALPGIGPYTAAAVSAIAFDRPETVLDGNVERVVARLFAVQTPLPTAKPELHALATRLTPQRRPGDHAQAMMDLGATICTPRNPACGLCPLSAACMARARGIAADLPRKLPKRPRPVRMGYVYLARRSDGAWLLETRPDKGLLGGMLAWPSSDWTETLPPESPPLAASWRDPGLEVRHTFTHFHLRLALRLADAPVGVEPSRGRFVRHQDFRPAALPTLMRKAYDLATAHQPD
ncbi:A/G-specific adenine glycosylase [Frigidibacter sp. ROC022]|uniref:A/G-specific adenine glycosylase n=1 Tax=Frigidibacter sp. ROC022 TaxID=2971796 RepID=UPI00215B685E|nr:A/G-specific adenine glycosylase [Frigidibacter sp. ROC022]MCR8724329.1 A/G-specific adenine glycosylase [Frigidibacter sp. ROC022]